MFIFITTTMNKHCFLATSDIWVEILHKFPVGEYFLVLRKSDIMEGAFSRTKTDPSNNRDGGNYEDEDGHNS